MPASMRAAAAVLRGASAPSRRCARCHFSSSASLTRLPPARHASTSTAAATTTILSLLLRPRRPANTTNLSPSSSPPPPPPPRRFFSQHAAAAAAADGADTSEPSSSSSSATAATATASSPYYALFPSTLPLGPPPRGHFPIDVRQLRREFLQLQARAHPDMHAPGAAKSAAETRSALINEAYRTLANPLLRAQHLLALRGVDVAGDERLKMDAAADESDDEAGAGLLMVVLEAREGIEEARTEADLEGLRTENDGRIREGEERLEEAFREDDVEKAKREAVKMRYWVNIKESLDNWEQGKPIVLQH
ncbi:hypothetical protein BB8028_0002g13670 [Beauveria bassiana]|uniref:Co-chaperone HscB C-terminal oligomerisation domain-containing protein n=1 Tax=Beauveria bassiana TaxID=176275 RepID=A0A2S7Y4R5_BEABA|nr:hypothetical protein BB8028_0002g13670 [Beauveria bassiana]